MDNIYKTGMNEEFSNMVELVNFNVFSEKEKFKRIEEFRIRNEENKLQYCLGEIEDEWYWVNLAEATKADEIYRYKNSLICPHCLKPVTLIPEGIRKSHFRHKKDSEENDCPFKIKIVEFWKSKKYSKLSESEKHKEIKKWGLQALIGQFVKVCTGGYIEINYETLESRIVWEETEMMIIDTKTEKRILYKNEETNGYQPDLLATLTDGSKIIIEVTVTSGKTEKEYGDIWRKLEIPVFEIRDKGEGGFKETKGKPKLIPRYNKNFDSLKRKKLEVDMILSKIKKLKREKDVLIDKRYRKFKQRSIDCECLNLMRFLEEDF